MRLMISSSTLLEKHKYGTVGYLVSSLKMVNSFNIILDLIKLIEHLDTSVGVGWYCRMGDLSNQQPTAIRPLGVLCCDHVINVKKETNQDCHCITHEESAGRSNNSSAESCDGPGFPESALDLIQKTEIRHFV